MITGLVAKATLGSCIALSGLTGAAHVTDLNKTNTVKVEAMAPVKTAQAQKQVIVKSQDEVKNIVLKHTLDTVKKVDKAGHMSMIHEQMGMGHKHMGMTHNQMSMGHKHMGMTHNQIGTGHKHMGMTHDQMGMEHGHMPFSKARTK